MISQSAPIPFSLTFSESRGVASSSESTHHFCKVFRWWFLSRLRPSFCWLFCVNRGFEICRIHASPLKVVSLSFSESTGAASASKSMRHLWKVFRWWFPSRHRLCFRWLFRSQQGLRALLNPRVILGRCFGDDFPVATDSLFVDVFLANKGCELFLIHASPLKVVSLTFSESTRAENASKSTRHLWNVFWWRFPAGTESVLVDFFWDKRGCGLFWIHASPLKGVSVMISEAAVT